MGTVQWRRSAERRLPGAGCRQRALTAQEWLLAQIQKVLDYVQPDTFVFHITEPIGNFILVPPPAAARFLMEGPWFIDARRLTRSPS